MPSLTLSRLLGSAVQAAIATHESAAVFVPLLVVRTLRILFIPLLLDGISFGATGAADAYFIEGSDFSQFDADAQSWSIVGDIVDVNGGSPNCAWDKDNGGCA